MSGAVGNFANIPPFIQDYVCERLEISSANISTQVLQRDRHAYYLATLSTIAIPCVLPIQGVDLKRNACFFKTFINSFKS